MAAKASDVCSIFKRQLALDKAITFATNIKLLFRDAGLYIQSGADGKLTISADGTGTDDITIDGTVTLTDDLITPTSKKVQFRDTGIYINSGADGKLTISADGTGTDDITLDGKVTVNDDVTMIAGKNVLGVADGIKANGVIVPARTIAVANVPAGATAADFDGRFFIADAA